MIGIFSKTIRPGVYLAYAVCQGLVLGIISKTYELFYPGIVQQAIVATAAAFIGMLTLYKSGRLRVTPKFTRMLLGAAIGYLVLALGSLIGSFFGLGGGAGLYGLSGFGPLLAVAGVAIASFFLILDFDQIEEGVRAGVPQEESWRAGFGLLMTMVWLYLEAFIGGFLESPRWAEFVSGIFSATIIASENTAALTPIAVRYEKASEIKPSNTGPTIIPASPAICQKA
jgi:uncharacterized YccA/Bax inhibitor family protein